MQSLQTKVGNNIKTEKVEIVRGIYKIFLFINNFTETWSRQGQVRDYETKEGFLNWDFGPVLCITD